jgi:hypothetical protein
MWKSRLTIEKVSDVCLEFGLGEKDHLEFHKIYGRKNNTQEQLDEFISMKRAIINK